MGDGGIMTKCAEIRAGMLTVNHETEKAAAELFEHDIPELLTKLAAFRADNTRLVAQVESQRTEINELRKSIPPLLLERDGWKCRAEAAEADLRVANKCITCAHNTGTEGEKWCKSPDKSIRFVNRKEDRYIRAECCGWEWRGPQLSAVPEGRP